MVKKAAQKLSAEDQIRRVESADLEMLQEHLERLWDFLPNPTCDINGALIIINVGKSFLDFFSYQKTEIIGESIEKIFFKKEDFESFKKELSGKQAISHKEFTLVGKNGKIVPATVFVSPKKVEGMVISYLVAFLDLTAVKEKETELEEKIKQLEFFQKLAEGRELKMVELKEKLEELRQKINNKK